MLIKEIIDKLVCYHPSVGNPHTCDVVKIGNTEAECTGIAVTTFASVEVIKKAVAQNINLVIVHEPLFYSHDDDTEWLAGNAAFEAKHKLIEESGIVVYRDHDRMHAGNKRPRENMDMIFYGIMKTLGWDEYCVGFDLKPQVYRFPKRSVASVADELMEKLNLNGVRIVGDENTMIETVFFCEHVTGAKWGPHDKDRELITGIENAGYDLMIPFEIIDWTLTEFIRDSSELGMPKAIIEAGHFNVEEAGMQYMALWLPEVLDNAVPVTYIQSGDFFTYRTR